MLVIKSENIKPFDIDNTLILSKEEWNEKARHVGIQDPVTPSEYILARVHEPNVRLLLEELQRGAQVIVWSRSGWEWAHNVLKALGIEHDNIMVMSKPLAYFDDQPVETWLKDRIWLDPNTPYKE